MKKQPHYTELGVWYKNQSRIAKKKFLDDAYQRGLSSMRVRLWMYKPIIPTIENLKIMEELTGIKYEQLFPY